MKVSCKNIACKHYYSLKQGEHCEGEGTCRGYTANKKKAKKEIQRCKECVFCKKIYTNQMQEYHYECMYNNRHRLLLLIDERICDCKL